MRNSTLRAITASVTAVAMVVSLGTSPVLARGGGGGHGGIHVGGGGFHGGGFHGGGGFHAAGGFHRGGYAGYHRGYYGGGYYGGGYYACATDPVPVLNVVSPYWCG
jgi:hypothetical protein